MFLDTIQEPWKVLNQKSVEVSAANATNANTAWNTGYSATWATGAQNPSLRPGSTTTYPGAGAKELLVQTNGIRLRFLVADTNNDQVTGTLWGWDKNGAPQTLLVVNPIQAHTVTCTVNPTNGATLTSFFHPDIVTITYNNCDAVQYGSATYLPIETRFDAVGLSYLYFDFDCDLGSGTDGTDGICLYKEY